MDDLDDVNNVMDSLYDHITQGTPLEIGLHSPDTPLEYDTRIIPGMGDLEISIHKLMGGKARWSVALTDDLLETASMSGAAEFNILSREYMITESSKNKHDLVADAFSRDTTRITSTDTKLSAAFPLQNDSYDNMSPDIIEYIHNIPFVIEVTTSEVSSIRALRNIWSDKRNKYLDAMINRSRTTPLIYMVILVSTNKILTSFPLSNMLVSVLSCRFSLGVQIESRMKELQLFRSSERSAEDTVARAIFDKITNIRPKPNDPNGMTSEYIKMLYEKRPDSNYVSQTTSINLAQSLLFVNEETQTNKNNEFLDSLLESYTVQDGRKDRKYPIQIPLVVADFMEGVGMEPRIIPEHSNDTPTMRLFSLASSQRVSDPNWHDEDPTLIMNLALGTLADDFQFNKEKRKKWHRVLLDDIPKPLMIELNELGFQAKKLKYETLIQANRVRTQKPFCISSPTDDIDEFMATLPQPCDPQSAYHFDVQRLLRTAERLMENEEVFLTQIEKLMRTDIYQSLELVSKIAIELSISINQNVKKDMFIYKRIRDQNVTLLIHPTKSSSHVFFCVCYTGDIKIIDGPFTKLTKGPNGYYTQMLSVNKNRLQNWISSPAIWLNSMVHWAQRENYPAESISTSLRDKDVTMMANLTIMIALEDRPRTEQIISETRYAILELAKGTDGFCPVDLTNKAAKFPTILRSRLQVWLIKKIANGLRIMNERKPICLGTTNEPEDTMLRDKNGDNWVNFVNFYTGKPVESFEVMIDLMYLGYVCNKERTSEVSTGFDLISKIVQETVNFHNDDDIYCSGHADPPVVNEDGSLRDVKPHEWSPSYVSQGLMLMAKHLKDKFGVDWKSKIKDNIMEELHHRAQSINLATLKASTILPRVPCQAQLLESHKKGGSASSTSKKCIEEIVRLLSNFGMIPALVLDEIIDVVENEHGGVACRLFAKNQHAGIREIYVLTMPSRILQIICECCARAIDSCFPEETLTNPENKTKLVDEHFRDITTIAARTSMDSEIINRYSSEDKTRWNQRIDVRVFAMMAVKLLPKEFHGCLTRILSLWKSKKVYLPEDLQDDLVRGVVRDDEVYRLIKRAFDKNLTDEDPNSANDLFTTAHSAFVNVKMGMWQGILHLFSSMLHLCQSVHYKAQFDAHMMPILQNHGCSSAKITTLISSDDSLTLISAVVPKELDKDNKSTIDFILATYCKYAKKHCKYFNMTDSTKSVIGTKHVFEYNSTFILLSCVLNPQLKFIYASIPAVEAESLKHRQEICHNAVKDLIENGVTVIQSHYHQIIQGIMHYYSLGAGVSPIFSQWSESVRSCPEPSLGFFLLSDTMTTGLMPFRYDYFRILTNNLMPVLMGVPVQASSGLFIPVTSQYLITHGSRTRWKRLQDAVCVDDWMKEMDKNKELYFGAPPKNEDELRLVLSMKASSTGVYESLRGSGRMVAMFQSSVYVLSSPCITVMTTDYTIETDQFKRDTEKNSLFMITTKHASIITDWPETRFDRAVNLLEQGDTRMINSSANADLMGVIFPNKVLYDSVYNETERLKQTHVRQPCDKYRKRKTVIRMKSDLLKLAAPPLKALREKWFGKNKLSRTTIEACYSKLRHLFSWISDDLEQTIEESPFQNAMELASFLKSLEDKTSMVTPICKPIKSTTTLMAIRECAKYNPWPMTRYVRVGELARTAQSEMSITRLGGKKSGAENLGETRYELEMFKNRVDLTLMLPVSDDCKLGIISEQGDLDINETELLECVETSKLDPLTKLSIMLIKLNELLDDTTLIKRLMNIYGGYAPVYIIRQVYDEEEGKYVGWGMIRVYFKNKEHIDVIFHDNNLHSLIASKRSVLQGSEMILRTVCSDNKITGFTRIPVSSDIAPYFDEAIKSTLKFDRIEFKEFRDDRLACDVHIRTVQLEKATFDPETFGELELKINNEHIMLMLRTSDPSVPYESQLVSTLISYRCEARGGAYGDADDGIPTEFGTEFIPSTITSSDELSVLFSNWYYFRKAHKNDLSRLIMSLYQSIEIRGMATDSTMQLRDWCRRSLTMRLKNFSIIKSQSGEDQFVSSMVNDQPYTMNEEVRALLDVVLDENLMVETIERLKTGNVVVLDTDSSDESVNTEQLTTPVTVQERRTTIDAPTISRDLNDPLNSGATEPRMSWADESQVEQGDGTTTHADQNEGFITSNAIFSETVYRMAQSYNVDYYDTNLVGVLEPVDSIRQLLTTRNTSVLVNHPFWDDMIIHYKEINLWNSVLNAAPTTSALQTSHKMLTWLLRETSPLSQPVVVEDLFDALNDPKPPASEHSAPIIASNASINLPWRGPEGRIEPERPWREIVARAKTEPLPLDLIQDVPTMIVPAPGRSIRSRKPHDLSRERSIRVKERTLDRQKRAREALEDVKEEHEPSERERAMNIYSESRAMEKTLSHCSLSSSELIRKSVTKTVSWRDTSKKSFESTSVPKNISSFELERPGPSTGAIPKVLERKDVVGGKSRFKHKGKQSIPEDTDSTSSSNGTSKDGTHQRHKRPHQ